MFHYSSHSYLLSTTKQIQTIKVLPLNSLSLCPTLRDSSNNDDNNDDHKERSKEEAMMAFLEAGRSVETGRVRGSIVNRYFELALKVGTVLVVASVWWVQGAFAC